VNSDYNKESSLQKECDIVSKIFDDIEVKVNSNNNCCEVTSDGMGSIWWNISCKNNHITEM